MPGFDRTARRIAALGAAGPRGVGSALRVIGEIVMTDIKATRKGKGVPLDRGPLRASGRVSGPTGGDNPVVTLSFGGPYALRQHEELSYRHNVGEARYLVRGVQRFQEDPRSGRQALRDNLREATEIAKAVP